MADAGATSTAGAGAPSREYGCLTCVAKFDGSKEQRAHMRGDWQYVSWAKREKDRRTNSSSVSNLKRRLESLPPLSEADFHEQQLPSSTKNLGTEASSSLKRSRVAREQHETNPQAPSNALASDEGQSSDEAEADFNPDQCLFCNVESDALGSNLMHMSNAHGFFIPNIEYLVDIESFLGYLFTIITNFHECLFCGRLKNTDLGVRDHMQAKGHCKLNLEHAEHQLSQFYDFSESMQEQDDDEEEQGEEATRILNEGERLLPSGKIVGRASRVRNSHHSHPKHSSSGPSSIPQHDTLESELDLATRDLTSSLETPDRTVALRAQRAGTSTSLIGLSDFQRRALMATELKAEKMEARARNEYQSKIERIGNKQKTYRVLSMGKKAGGLEKRLG